MKKKMFFGTGTLLLITFCFLCAWTWLEREPEASVAVPSSFRGKTIDIHEVVQYLSWMDKDLANGELVSFWLPDSSAEDSESKIGFVIQSEHGLVENVYLLQNAQFTKKEDGKIFFSVRQKNDVDLAQSD